MADNIVPFEHRNQESNGSPFDSIRQIDEKGIEFWSARSLMEMLEYVKWQKFKEVIDIAGENLEVSGMSAFDHFLPVEVRSQGRPSIDYRLSRLACYHVVLACDSRGKPMIKQAKHYFAIRTREAEVAIPAMSGEIQKLQLENENMKLKLQVYEAQTKAMAAASTLAIVAPAIAEAIVCPGVTIIEKVEHIDRTVIVDHQGYVQAQLDGLGITAIQKQFGFGSTKKAWDWLESVGYGKGSGHWQSEMTAHPTAKLDRSVLPDLKTKFAQRKGDRQKLIGE